MEVCCWSVWGTPKSVIKKYIESTITQPPIVLCLGNNLAVEDCLGPLVGTTLKKMNYSGFVYGTLDAPINSSSLECAYNFVKKVHPNKQILVVDASTTKDKNRLGKIVLAKEYKPLNPNLKNVNLKADWFLFGVCSTHQNNIFSIAGAKLGIVKKIADVISDVIIYIDNKNFCKNFNPQSLEISC